MHKDTKFNLVACERHDQPKERMLRDLTQNQGYAQTVIAAAHRFFLFDLSRVRFSGFAREHDDWDGEIGDYGPAFYVQVWHNAKMVRQVGIRSLGILGTLHVEVIGSPSNIPEPVMAQQNSPTMRARLRSRAASLSEPGSTDELRRWLEGLKDDDLGQYKM